MRSQDFAQSGKRRRFTDDRQRKLQAQGPLEFHCKYDRVERIATRREEVILWAADGGLQYFFPDLRYGHRDEIARRRWVGFSGNIGAFVLDVDVIQDCER